MIEEFKLETGDIFATKGKGITGWASRKLVNPPTDRFHFGIIWKCLGDDDFLILESISKGLAVGLLSWYVGQDIKFYRVNCDEDLRFAAPDALVGWGRSRYDYWLIVKLVFGAIVALARILWKEHKVRKLRAEDLSSIYSWDSKLLCTEAAWVAYNSQGVNIIPYGVPPLPSSFRQAELESRLSEVRGIILIGKIWLLQ